MVNGEMYMKRKITTILISLMIVLIIFGFLAKAKADEEIFAPMPTIWESWDINKLLQEQNIILINNTIWGQNTKYIMSIDLIPADLTKMEIKNGQTEGGGITVSEPENTGTSGISNLAEIARLDIGEVEKLISAYEVSEYGDGIVISIWFIYNDEVYEKYLITKDKVDKLIVKGSAFGPDVIRDDSGRIGQFEAFLYYGNNYFRGQNNKYFVFLDEIPSQFVGNPGDNCFIGGSCTDSLNTGNGYDILWGKGEDSGEDYLQAGEGPPEGKANIAIYD